MLPPKKNRRIRKIRRFDRRRKKKSYEIVGLGALKYFMLKVDPKRKMLFQSCRKYRFQRKYGTFIQYTYARIQSLLNRANFVEADFELSTKCFEKELIMQLSNFKDVVEKLQETLSPAQVANYVYDLVKTYNSFYQNNPVMTLEDENAKHQTQISDLTSKNHQKILKFIGN